LSNGRKHRSSRDDLKQLGGRLSKVDQHIVALLRKRTDLVRQVEEWKSLEAVDPGGQAIVRQGIEAQRLEQFAKLAEDRGLSPDFAKVILWAIMAESCKVQIRQKQQRNPEEEALFESDRQAWYGLLKQNLLRLTQTIAPVYDGMYGAQAPFSTQLYMAYEREALVRTIETLRGLGNLDVAVDLGCATGLSSFLMAPHFKKVHAYDIGPAMILRAKEKAASVGASNIAFEERDIELSIPLPADYASLVVMNLGTASDVLNLRVILSQIKRILKKDGRFILSFYNSSALFYNWFIPWPVSLAAEVNPTRHCLDVHCGKEVFQVYARPYTVREVKSFLQGCQLTISDIGTYPTLASILPNEFFDEEEIVHTVRAIDRKLIDMEKGAYILVTGRKP